MLVQSLGVGMGDVKSGTPSSFDSLRRLHRTWRREGLARALIKVLERLSRRTSASRAARERASGVLASFPELPTRHDAEVWLSRYPRWKYVLPLPNERMMGRVGADGVENFFVVADAWAQLLSRFIQPGSAVLDVGSGCGRTARLLAINPHVEHFVGIDTIEPYVAWCRRFFDEVYPDRFQFHHLDVHSEHYNPLATLRAEDVRFPIEDGQIDLAYAASLFTHLLPAGAQNYVKEMHRVLRADGLAILSIHDVPEPMKKFSGDEHRADYDRGEFLESLQRIGFAPVDEIDEFCGQRVFIVAKANRRG